MLEISTSELIVDLSFWETFISSLRGIRIPLAHVSGATADDRYHGAALGIRAPGVGIPGLISAGIYRKGGDVQFVFVTRKTHPVVIELRHEKWQRIVLGVPDARSAALRINAAIR